MTIARGRPGRPRVGFARWRADAASGGNKYDDELASGLQKLGVDLREYPVIGSWPLPTQQDRRRFDALLDAEEHWLIGNILGSAAPEALRSAATAGKHITLLLHYFPADDPALPIDDRAGLAVSEAKAVQAASAIVVTSAWAAREVFERYARGDAVIATPGVTPAPLAAGSARLGEPPMLLWLGRISQTKDPLTFIEALIRVRGLDWTAQLVGPGSVGNDLSAQLRACIARAHLDDRVELTGERRGNALDAIWQRTDLLVHTSRAETYGMVVAEALSRGIPSIISSGTGAEEAQRAGATFTSGDADALALALRCWLTRPALRERWRAEAARSRNAQTGWDETARRVLAALED